MRGKVKREHDGAMDSLRRHASSQSPYEQTVGFSRAVRVGDRIVVAGTAPIGDGGQVSPDPAAQARRCWEIALTALGELGGKPEDVVLTRHYLTDTDPDLVDAVSTVHGEIFGQVRPAATMIAIGALLDPRWKLEVELEAIVTGN